MLQANSESSEMPRREPRSQLSHNRQRRFRHKTTRNWPLARQDAKEHEPSDDGESDDRCLPHRHWCRV